MNKEILNLFKSSEIKAQILAIVAVIWLVPVIIAYFMAVFIMVRPLNYLIGLFKK